MSSKFDIEIERIFGPGTSIKQGFRGYPNEVELMQKVPNRIPPPSEPTGKGYKRSYKCLCGNGYDAPGYIHHIATDTILAVGSDCSEKAAVGDIITKPRNNKTKVSRCERCKEVSINNKCEGCSNSRCSCGSLTINKYFQQCANCDKRNKCDSCGYPYTKLYEGSGEIYLNDVLFLSDDIIQELMQELEQELDRIELYNDKYCTNCISSRLVHGKQYRIPTGMHKRKSFSDLFHNHLDYITQVLFHGTPLAADFEKCSLIYTEEHPELLNNYIIDFGKFYGRGVGMKKLYEGEKEYFNNTLKETLDVCEKHGLLWKFQFMALWYFNYRKKGSYKFGHLKSIRIEFDRNF
jgi:hypothetical protein